MLSVLARLKVLEGKVDEYEALAAQLVRDVHADDPQAIYEVLRVRGEPLTYVYFWQFTDQAAYDRYLNADYHTAMARQAFACIDGDAVFEELESIS